MFQTPVCRPLEISGFDLTIDATGVGIPEQDRQKITERFHRVAVSGS